MCTEPAEMIVKKVDHIIAATRSTVPPETIHTAQAERRGRNQPSRWRVEDAGVFEPDGDPFDDEDFVELDD